jgi:hypothetical protein
MTPPSAITIPALLIPAALRKCVAYLVVDDLDEDSGVVVRKAAGTVFFVSVPVEDVGHALYAVTARHVIDSSRPYRASFLRLNQTGDAYSDIAAPPPDEWHMHPDTDVAAARVSIPGQNFDVMAIPQGNLMPDDAAARRNVSEGDEVILLGLFTAHPGESRSEPVARFGHIARMPYDPIPIKMDPAPESERKSVRAYLVEAASWGGQSGSPAFIHFAPDREPGKIVMGDGPEVGVLGLVHGHYRHEQTVGISVEEEEQRGTIDMNLGISVVIPAEDISALLLREDLEAERREAASQIQK